MSAVTSQSTQIKNQSTTTANLSSDQELRDDKDHKVINFDPSDDVAKGSSGADKISGGDGNDRIRGRDGNDQLYGGAGNDRLDGGAGTDYLDGGAGNDTLHGRGGDDRLQGGEGADTLKGDAGDDTLTGGAGADLLNGGAGFDRVSYRGSTSAVTVDLAAGTASGGDATGDTLSGIEGVIGSAFNDTLSGNNDANILNGGAGDDTLKGDAGDDTLTGGAGADLLDGGAGFDRVSYRGSTSAVTVDLAAQTASGGDATGDTLSGIEGVIGSAFNDTLSGNNDANILNGGAGDDTMAGRLGNDTYVVDSAGDVVIENAGEGTDRVNASISYTLGANLENLLLTGDTAINATDNAAINGTGNSADNVITGNTGNNTLSGLDGNDTLNGSRGNDTLIGGDGADRFVFVNGSGHDVISDFTSADVIDLKGYDGLDSFQDLDIHASGADVIITFGNDATLKLSSVSLASINADDFRF
jgi:Ca2+-binding RTX toxin-like protein